MPSAGILPSADQSSLSFTRRIPVREGIMIRASLVATASIAATAWALFGPPAFGQAETDQRLGTVHFATSCNETAQRRFDRGMRYQHSFWYSSSREIFEVTLKADPECA